MQSLQNIKHVVILFNESVVRITSLSQFPLRVCEFLMEWLRIVSHTHAYTLTHTHSRTHAGARARARALTHTHGNSAYIYTHTDTHTAHTHTHTKGHTRARESARICVFDRHKRRLFTCQGFRGNACVAVQDFIGFPRNAVTNTFSERILKRVSVGAPM